jgi:anti-sigma factor ChrR (cupin superfamily)
MRARSRGRRHRGRHHAGELRSGVLQGEVLMTGGLQAVVADLTLDPHAADVTLQHIADLAGELGDGQESRAASGMLRRHLAQMRAKSSRVTTTQPRSQLEDTRRHRPPAAQATSAKPQSWRGRGGEEERDEQEGVDEEDEHHREELAVAFEIPLLGDAPF